MILEDGIFRSTVFEDPHVIHGFTTRERGNLGFGRNLDDPEVVQNRRRLFEVENVTDRHLVQPRQVHSNRCLEALEFVPGKEADASYCNSAAFLLSVLTADCVPILLYHPEGVVSAIHAGWRGLYKDIISKTVARLPEHPLAAVGPAIGTCCYEVGEDLASNFSERFGSDVVVRGSSSSGIASQENLKPHLDLVGIAILQLQQAGVQQIEAAHLCTFCHPDLFFSYRRNGSSGRMMSFIGLK